MEEAIEAEATAKEYAALRASIAGDAKWNLPENKPWAQLELNSKENAEKYIKSLREKLARFGANENNIRIRTNPATNSIVIEVDKQLLWQHLGFYEAKENVRMIHEHINKFLGLAERRKGATSKEVLENINDYIINLLDTCENGKGDVYPAYPQWIQENKGVLKTWLKSSILTENTKQRINEALDPSLKKQRRVEVFNVTMPKRDVDKATMEVEDVLDHIDMLIHTLEQNIGYHSRIHKDYFQSNTLPEKSPQLDQDMRIQNTINKAIAAFIDKHLNFPTDEKVNIIYPHWFETNRDYFLKITETDYVNPDLQQKILKHLNHKNYYARIYQSQDPVIRKIMAELDAKDKHMQTEMAKVIPGGKNLAHAIDRLLKNIENIDKSTLSTGAKAELISDLLNDLRKESDKASFRRHEGLRKIAEEVSNIPEIKNYLSQERTASEKNEAQMYRHLEDINRHGEYLDQTYENEVKAQTITTPTMFMARKVVTASRMNAALMEVLKMAPSEWFLENTELVNKWIKNGYIDHEVRQGLQKKIKSPSYFDRAYQPEDPLVKIVIAKILKVGDKYIEDRVGVNNLNLHIDALLTRLKKIETQGRGESQLIAETVRNLLSESFQPERFAAIMKMVREDHAILAQISEQIRQKREATTVLPTQSSATKSPERTAERKQPLFSQHRSQAASAQTSSRFNEAVFNQLNKISHPATQEQALKNAEMLAPILEASVLKTLNDNPLAAATLLRKDKASLEGLRGKSADEQLSYVENLVASPMPRRQKPGGQ